MRMKYRIPTAVQYETAHITPPHSPTTPPVPGAILDKIGIVAVSFQGPDGGTSGALGEVAGRLRIRALELLGARAGTWIWITKH